MKQEKDKKANGRSFAKAALATAGAVFLVRSEFGKRILSDSVRKANTFVSNIIRDSKISPLYERGGLEGIFRSTFTNQNSPLRKAINNNEITIRHENTNNLFSVLKDAYTISHSGMRKSLAKEFDRRLTNTVVNNNAKYDDILNQKIERYVNDIISSPNNAVRNKSLKDNLFTEKDLKRFNIEKINKDVLDIVTQRAKQRSDYIKKSSVASTEILDTLLDPNKLKKFQASKTKMAIAKVGNFDYVRVQDILDGKISAKEIYFSYQDKNQKISQDAFSYLRQLHADMLEKNTERAEEFSKLIIDPTLVKQNDKIFSFTEFADANEKITDIYAGSTLGRILKLRSFTAKNKIGNFTAFLAGDRDPFIASQLKKKNKNNPYLNNNIYNINGTNYSFDGVSLQHIKELDNTILVPGEVGFYKHITNQMIGNTNYKESDNTILRFLDIGQSKLDSRKGIFSKFEDEHWGHNVFNTILHEDNSQMSDVDYVSKLSKFNSLLRKNIRPLNENTYRKVSNMFSSPEAQNIADIINNLNGREMLSRVLNDEDYFANSDLNKLINTYIDNPNKINEMLTMKADNSFYKSENKAVRFFDLLKLELQKESFIMESRRSSSDHLIELFDTINATNLEKQETKELAYYSIFQHDTMISDIDKENKNIHEIRERAANIFNQDNDFKKDLISVFDDFSERTNSIFDKGSTVDPNILSPYDLNYVIHVPKTVTPLDLIKNINDSTMLKAQSKKMIKQFYAGRDNLEDVTGITMIPYFFLSRLSDPLADTPLEFLRIGGLNFSKDSMGSSSELIKSIAIKRVIPVLLGATAFNYTNDLLQATTGTGITGVAANTVANTDIGIRKIFDTVGISKLISADRSLNPISQYLFGDEYQDAEERKEWYEDGYSPVRKARYWSFGGLNEFRGGKVDYWQPNYLRRIESDYRDKSIYGNFLNKWSHSLMPTPTNPLSPLFWALDPYWIERQHKDDRPYMESGPLFTPGTPWSPILNATIGNLIKPIKRLHEKDEAGSFLDAKNAIAYINEEIKQRARDLFRQNKVSVAKGISVTNTGIKKRHTLDNFFRNKTTNSGGGTGYGEYSEETGSYPTSEEMSFNSEVYGMMTSTEEEDNVMSGRKYIKELEKKEFIDITKNNSGESAFYKTLNSIVTNKNKEHAISNYINVKKVQKKFGGNALIEVNNLNQDIMARALNKKLKKRNSTSEETLSSVRAKDGLYLLDNDDAIGELNNLSSGEDFIRESAETIRLLSGIYGYMGSQINKSSNKKYLAQASDITSFGRTFWDASIGGIGGETGDIIRRFIPTFKRGERLNPLRNKMPSWIPERFKHGDPYTKTPKGEMRLPGKGYESLNELHPDEYGKKYGAFDRFKILADVAPRSAEFKAWKKVATESVTDPKLQEEIKEINKRVNEQNKEHDFYPYKFIGKHIDYLDATISKVVNQNTFKIVGSDKIFKMAGIKTKSNEDGGNPLENYLFSGQEIKLGIDSNSDYRENRDVNETINAAVLVNGESVNKKMLDDGVSERRKGDTSAPAMLGTYGPLSVAYGTVFEGLSHIDLPIITNKFLKIRTPMDSYKAEHIYGKDYQTWEHPIKSFLIPAYNRSIQSGSTIMAANISTLIYNHIKDNNYIKSKLGRFALDTAHMLTNRGALIGGMTAGIATFNIGGETIRAGAKIGRNLSLAGFAFTRLEDPVQSAINFASIGISMAKYIEKQNAFDLLNPKDFKKLGKYAGYGAVIGTSLSFIHGAGAKDINLKRKPWIPKDTKKRWEIEEYFDRLNYLKYEGLYKKAAFRAKMFEFTDINKIYRLQEKENKRKDKLKKYLNNKKDFLNKFMQSDSGIKSFILNKINQELEDTKADDTILKVGKYGRAAMIYKEAAKSTVYGLNEHSTFAEIVRALPQEEREYFTEFAKEKDKKERKKILSYANPALKRALKITWREKEKQKSNSVYFAHHFLPNVTWAGWRPGVDLKNIKIKTIKNEGMLLSDFDLYDSESDKPEVLAARPIKYKKSNSNPASVRLKLLSIMNGLGLSGVRIDVNPSSFSDSKVNIDILKTGKTYIKESVKNVFTDE